MKRLGVMPALERSPEAAVEVPASVAKRRDGPRGKALPGCDAGRQVGAIEELARRGGLGRLVLAARSTDQSEAKVPDRRPRIGNHHRFSLSGHPPLLVKTGALLCCGQS